MLESALLAATFAAVALSTPAFAAPAGSAKNQAGTRWQIHNRKQRADAPGRALGAWRLPQRARGNGVLRFRRTGRSACRVHPFPAFRLLFRWRVLVRGRHTEPGPEVQMRA